MCRMWQYCGHYVPSGPCSTTTEYLGHAERKKKVFLMTEAKKLKTECVPTLKGLGSVHQVGPVQWAVCPSVRQRHEGRVLQLLLLPLLILLRAVLG